VESTLKDLKKDTAAAEKTQTEEIPKVETKKLLIVAMVLTLSPWRWLLLKQVP